MKQLTRKQQAFVTEYLKDFNGQQAAVRAGYAKQAARVQACDLLTRPHIRAAVGKAQEEARSAAVMSLGEMCETLTTMARDVEEKTFDRQQAMNQLAKLKGYNAPTKVAPTDPSGLNPYVGATAADLAALVAALPGLAK